MKFHGAVGYGEDVQDPPGSGTWIKQITEQNYYGDVIRNTRQLSEGTKVNNDISVSNSISIVADQFAIDNFLKILYVGWVGKLWTVTDVEVQSPRLILRLGSVYNGPTA